MILKKYTNLKIPNHLVTNAQNVMKILPMGKCKKSARRRRLDQPRGRHFEVRMHFQRLYNHTASTTESCVGQVNSLEGVWFRSRTPSRPLGRLRGGQKQALT